MTDLDRLIDEFAAQFDAGEQPNPAAFLARLEPTQRKAFADRIDAYLDTAPDRAWDAAAYEQSAAKRAADRVFESIEGEAGSWPELLPSLRTRARIQRETLTRRLAEKLGFGSDADVRRIHAYYHRMEHGQIPASGVSDQVLEALAGLVGSTRAALRSAGERVSGPGASGQVSFARTALPAPQFRQRSMDEVSDVVADNAEVTSAFASGETKRQDAGRDELDELFLGREV